MNQTPTNPYAPPPSGVDVARPLPSLETLDSHGPIRFSGAMQDRDLDEFLRADGHVGCVTSIAQGLCLGIIALALLVQGGGLVGLAIGTLGFFLVMSIVSTVHYRRLVFENENPDWAAVRHGELVADGIRLLEDEGTRFYRWLWYGDAIIADRWVVFVPANGTNQPVLVASDMLDQTADWDRVRDVAAAIALRLHTRGETRQHQKNLSRMRTPSRPRSIAVPPDALAWSGTVRSPRLQPVASGPAAARRNRLARTS